MRRPTSDSGGSLAPRIATSASRRDRLSACSAMMRSTWTPGLAARKRVRIGPRRPIATEIDRRHPQLAARLGVASGDAPLELQDRFGHRAGERDHFLARLGRLIAGARAFEQPRPDVVLDRRQATEHGGMIEIQRLGGADQRARVGDRLDQSEFVPVECGGHWRKRFRRYAETADRMRWRKPAVQENECRSRRDMRSRRQTSFPRGAAARRSRSLMATPSPRSGIGAAAMRAAPLSSSARR